MESDKKIIPFYILDILKEHTDSSHLLTYSQIIKKLKAIYNVSPNVKTIASSIDTLNKAGYEIVKAGYKGCYLSYRNFDAGELMYLVDAINSSKSIPAKQAKELIARLTKNCSKFERKRFKVVQKVDAITLPKNPELFYIIEVLADAIEQKKKVVFNYNEYNTNKQMQQRLDGKEYLINPYFMVNSNGKYYLVCNYDKYDDISNYKIELISNIRIIDEPAKDINSLKNTENFSVKKYISEHIYMTTGKAVPATIKVDEEKYINHVIEWFGTSISIRNNDSDGIFINVTSNETALIYWALQYGNYVEIIKPPALRNKFKETLQALVEKYDN